MGRFVQADTIIPGAGDSKSCDRYAYVNNNPVRYTDPSGHIIPDEIDQPGGRGYKPLTHYNGERAWKWAIDNYGVNDPSTEGREDVYSASTEQNCTDFVSNALLAAGLPVTDDWGPDLGDDSAWASTDKLFEYLTDYDKLDFNFIVLPIYPENGIMMSPSEIEEWFDNHIIPEGSLAFYNVDTEGITYLHVAIVGPDVIEFDEVSNAPLITDMNGGETKPRAVMDTGTYNNDRNNGGVNPYVIVFVILP